MSKVVSDSNLIAFGKAFKNNLSDVAISGSYNDLVDTPGDLQEYRQFTLFSDQTEGDYPSTPGNNDWKWYTNLDKLAPTSNSDRTWYGDWSTVATTTPSTPIIWIATATFQSSDGGIVSDWEVYQATGSTGSSGAKGDTGNGISSVTKTSSAGLVDTYTITFTDGTTRTFTVTNGETGTGIESVNEYYLATSASSGVTRSTSGWTTSIQSINSTNKYLWNYECVEYSDNTVVNSDPVIIGVYGDKGDDGIGISSITEYYLASTASSNVTTSTSGWTTSIQTINSTNRYLWNYEVVTYTDNTTHTTTPVIIGVYGEKGDSGTNGSDGFFLNTDATFIAVEVDSTAKATSTVSQKCNVKLYKGSTQENISGLGINDSTYTNDSATVSNISLVGHKTGGYYDYITISINSGQTLSSVQNIDVYVRGAVSGFTTQFKIIVAPIKEGQNGTNGTDGRGIERRVVKYMTTTTTTAPSVSSNSWSDNITSPDSTNKYLWKKTITTYTDNTVENDIDLITIYTDAASSDIAYLVETFGEANISNNDGVYLNNLVAVKNTANNQPIAMLNGTDILEDNTEGKMIIAAGMNGMDSSAQGYTEPVFQVYESGKLVAQDAEIEGSITATSGNIGGFEISASELAAENTTSQNEMSLSADDIKFTNGSGDYVRLGGALSSDSYITVTYNGSTYGISASNIGLYQDGLGMAIKDGTLAISNPGDKAILANGDIYLNGDINTTGYASTRKDVKVLSSSSASILDSDLRKYGTFICNGETYVSLPELSADNNGIIARFLFHSGGIIYSDSNDGSIITTFGNVGTAPTSGRPSCTISVGSVIEVIFAYSENKIFVYPINNGLTTS